MAIAEIRPDWTIGTLNLTSGSTAFTTTGSMLQTAAIQAGDEIITAAGLVLVIATITGQNAGTLMEPCPAGAAGTGQPLRIRFQPDGSRYNGATADLVQLLGSGNVYGFSGLEGVADGVPVFTGPGTMEVQGKDTFVTPDPNGNLAELGGLASIDNLVEIGGWTSDQVSDAASAVSYEQQILTEEQQGQSRQNIQADHAYDTIAAVTAANVPSYANAIRLNGHASVGDGLGGLYIDQDNGSTDTILSGDGRTWYRVKDVGIDRISAPFVSKVYKVVTPQDFDPLSGNSFHECHQSIQSAIDASLSDGLKLYIPNGEYGVSAPLRLRSKVLINAHPLAYIKAVVPTDIFRNFDEGGDYTGIEMNGGWTIEGGIWDNDCDNLSSNQSLLNIGKSSGWKIKNATFKNVQGGHVIDCAGNRDFLIENITIDGYNPLDRDFSEAIQIDKFSSTGFPVDITPSSFDDRPCSSGIIGNVITYRSGVVVGSHGGSIEAYHRDITIRNITSHDALMTVVRGQYWDGANISNIVSHGASMPFSTIVRLDYCKNTKGVNFIGRGKTQGRGVYVSYGDNVHIDGVVVVEAGEVGIDFLSCLNSSLSNGLVKKAAENGVDFRSCTDTKDVNSRVLFSGGVAVRSIACIRHTSLNATVSGDFVGGVSSNGGSDNLILNATVYDMNNSSKIGVQAAASASMPTIRNARIYGTAGQYGVLISGSVTNGWADGCDLRGYSGSGKLTVGGTTPLNTNNQL